MTNFKYEYIVIGRWRNRDKVNEVVFERRRDDE